MAANCTRAVFIFGMKEWAAVSPFGYANVAACHACFANLNVAKPTFERSHGEVIGSEMFCKNNLNPK